MNYSTELTKTTDKLVDELKGIKTPVQFSKWIDKALLQLSKLDVDDIDFELATMIHKALGRYSNTFTLYIKAMCKHFNVPYKEINDSFKIMWSDEKGIDVDVRLSSPMGRTLIHIMDEYTDDTKTEKRLLIYTGFNEKVREFYAYNNRISLCTNLNEFRFILTTINKIIIDFLKHSKV